MELRETLYEYFVALIDYIKQKKLKKTDKKRTRNVMIGIFNPPLLT